MDESADSIKVALAFITFVYGTISGIVKNKRNVKVKTRFPNDHEIRIIVTNRGIPIAIERVGFINSNDEKIDIDQLDIKKREFPIPINKENPFTFTFDLDVNILLYLIEVQGYNLKSAFVSDSEGNCYTANLPRDLVDLKKFSNKGNSRTSAIGKYFKQFIKS